MLYGVYIKQHGNVDQQFREGSSKVVIKDKYIKDNGNENGHETKSRWIGHPYFSMKRINFIKFKNSA